MGNPLFLSLTLTAAIGAVADPDVTTSFDSWNMGEEYVMPVGAGDLGAMVSVVTNAVELHLSKTDYLAEADPETSLCDKPGLELLSPGHVTLAFDNLTTNDFTSFAQTLDPRRATVTVVIGTRAGSITCVIYGDRASGALCVDVTDTREDRGTAHPVYSVWRCGKGILEKYRIHADVQGDPAGRSYAVLVSCGEDSRAAVRHTESAGRRRALADWWADFWSKGFVILEGDERAENLTRWWWTSLYSYASVGYGPIPPKFNGGAGLVQRDRRHWGKDLWWNNTRDMLWPLCVSGHPDLAKAILDFYDGCYANLLARAPELYPEFGNAGIVVLPETMSLLDSSYFTRPTVAVPDVTRAYREPTEEERAACLDLRRKRKSDYTNHIYSSGGELVQQMIEYVRFTGDRSYLPVIARWLRAVTEMYVYLLEREADGKWHVHHTHVNESWWDVDDSIVDLAAARFVFAQTVAHGAEFGYPSNLVAVAAERLRNLAPLPTAERIEWGKRPYLDVRHVVPGDRIYVPCRIKDGDRKICDANNDLYVVMPFAYCNEGADRDRGIATFDASFDNDCSYYGWSATSLAAAWLRLPDAVQKVYRHAEETHRWPYGGGRSPSLKLYKGCILEEAPYLDGSGVTMTGVQELLLQSQANEPSADFFNGGRITVLPCRLPSGWKVRFRLHARGRKMVEYPDFGKEPVESGTAYVREAIRPWVEDGTLPGAISVLYDKGIAETACVGTADPEGRVPLSLDTPFMQCSQTKGFCGVTVAILVEEGKIALDDPVSEYLPEYGELWVETSKSNGVRTLVRVKNVLTVRQALNHTAGFGFELPSFHAMGGWSHRMPLRSVAASAAALPLEYEPGAKFKYSNLGIDVGAAVVEAVTGKRWEEFLSERVLKPLEMTATTFNPSDDWLEKRLVLCDVRDGRRAVRRDDHPSMQRPFGGDRLFASAGAGLWTTARDQLKFYKMLMNLGTGDNGVRILKPETVKSILAVSTRPAEMPGYSLGLDAPVADVEDAWFGHGGAWNTRCMVNWHRRQLKLWVVQTCGLGGYEAPRLKAVDRFFAHSRNLCRFHSHEED